MSGLGKCSAPSLTEMPQGSRGFTVLRKDNPLASRQTGQAFSQAFLSALALLQQNIEHLHTLVRLIAQGGQVDAVTTEQQLTAAGGMATVITQLIAVAAGFLTQEQQQPSQSTLTLPVDHLGAARAEAGLSMDVFLSHSAEKSLAPAIGGTADNNCFVFPAGQQRQAANNGCSSGGNALNGSIEFAEQFLGSNLNKKVEKDGVGGDLASHFCTEFSENISPGKFDFSMINQTPLLPFNSRETTGSLEDLETGNGSRDEEDDGDAENLPPGSYELIELDAMEILAEHTHFCEICGKGFKRDANLRMHMRGHGDEYKTAAALAKPDKFLQDLTPRRPRRYSCPFHGCKRNKKHKKFLPLKTLLCVKNHYRRSHCPKMLTCPKCKVKKFSLVADLKTHGKHCGTEKWQCSCGTTFSRKDKLMGHVALFLGHTPASPLYETDSPGNGEKNNIEIGSITENMIANGRGDIYLQGKMFGFGVRGRDDLEVKADITSPGPVVDGGCSAGGARDGGLSVQRGDSNQGGIALPESENYRPISGSQFTPLAMFQQNGLSLLNNASDFHDLFGSNYMMAKQSRGIID